MACYIKKDGSALTQAEIDLIKSGSTKLDGSTVLVGKTKADLRTALLGTKQLRNSLTFYHAGFESRVEDVLNNLSSNYASIVGRRRISQQSVTSIASSLNPFSSKSLTSAQKFVSAFQIGKKAKGDLTMESLIRQLRDPMLSEKEKGELLDKVGLGDLIHAFFEVQTQTDQDVVLDVIATHILRYRKQYKSLPIEEKNEFTSPGQQNLVSFLQSLKTRENVLGNLNTQLVSIKDQIKERFKGYKEAHELPIALKALSGSWITGRIDALYYKEDPISGKKEIVIVDYKTKITDTSYSKADISYYLQLSMYKRMLQLLGLNDSDLTIRIENIFLNYSPTGSISFNINNNIIDLDDNMSLSGLQQAKHVLNSYLPDAYAAAISQDQEEAIKKTLSLYEELFDTAYLQRLKPKFFKDELKKRMSRNETIHSFKYNGAVYIEQTPEGNWTLYAIDKRNTRTNVYTNATVEEISEEETKEAMLKLKENTVALSTPIRRKSVDGIRNLISSDKDKAEKLYQNVSRYLNAAWVYQSYPQLEALGIMCFKHIDGTYDFLILNDFSIGFGNLIDGSGNLISGIDGASPAKKLQKTYGNALKLKGLLAISPFIKALSEATGTKIKLGNVNTLSLITGEKDNLDVNPFIESLKELQRVSPNFAGIYDNIKDNVDLIPQIELYQQELTEAVFAKEGDSIVKRTFDNYDSLTIAQKIERLRALQNRIKTNNPKLVPEDPTKIDLSSPAGRIYAMASNLILKLQGLDTSSTDKVTQYSLTAADTISSLLSVLSSGNIFDFTDGGQKVTGIFGGMDFANAYNNPSRYVQWGNARIMAYQHSISKDFIDSIDESNAAAIEFINAQIAAGVIKGGTVVDSMLGAHRPAYLRLLQQGKNGDYLPLCKNPFTSTRELSTAEIKYLKQFLWNINKFRMPETEFPAKYKKMSFAELMQSREAQAFFEAKLRNRSWLNLPLMPSAKVRGFLQTVADFFTGKKKGKQVFQYFGDRLERFASPNDLSIRQLESQEKAMQKLENFNIYRDSEESRMALIEHYESINSFELNFNYLQNDLQLKYITENYNKHLLQEIRDLIVVLQMVQQTCDIDLSEQVAAVKDRTKVMLYGNDLEPAEIKQFGGAMGTVKSALSLAKLGFRPSSLVKEGIVGRLKNWSTAAAKLIVTPTGKSLGLKAMLEAGTKVWPDGLISGKIGSWVGHHELGQFTKIEAICNHYQISDRDMHTISESMSADREGLWNAGLRTAYYTSVRLDWYNRNQILVGCMITDGCFEAHSYNQKTGELKYDMSKDERFSEFWKHRYDATYSTENFEYQKALYLAMMQQFNMDSPMKQYHYGEVNDPTTGRPIYDALPAAYTSKQLASIKEQIGMLYGNYDHQEKTNFENRTWWNLMTSMLTYLPGEIHKYFMKKGQNSIGSYSQLKDENGNPLYYDEDGHVTTSKQNSSGRFNRPVIEFLGSQAQGLAISTISLLGKICRGTFHAIKDQDLSTFKTISQYEINSSMVCLFNILWGALYGWLLILIWKWIFGSEEPTPEQQVAFDKTLTILGRSGNDISFYTSLVKPIDEFGLVGFNFVKDTGGDAINAIGGTIEDVEKLASNISLIKDVAPYFA